METLIEIKSNGKPTLIKPIGEVQALMRRKFDDTTVDLWVLNMETGKTVEITVNGSKATTKKYV